MPHLHKVWTSRDFPLEFVKTMTKINDVISPLLCVIPYTLKSIGILNYNRQWIYNRQVEGFNGMFKSSNLKDPKIKKLNACLRREIAKDRRQYVNKQISRADTLRRVWRVWELVQQTPVTIPQSLSPDAFAYSFAFASYQLRKYAPQPVHAIENFNF